LITKQKGLTWQRGRPPRSPTTPRTSDQSDGLYRLLTNETLGESRSTTTPNIPPGALRQQAVYSERGDSPETPFLPRVNHTTHTSAKAVKYKSSRKATHRKVVAFGAELNRLTGQEDIETSEISCNPRISYTNDEPIRKPGAVTTWTTAQRVLP
jgi:hypothetical protein